jgi:hypothetical protein
MATQQTPAPFVWGSGGRRMTPEEIEKERKLLQAAGQTDYSPIQHWTQGLGRVTSALIGGLDDMRLRSAERRNNEETAAVLRQLFGGGASGASGGATPPASFAPATPAPVASEDLPPIAEPRPSPAEMVAQAGGGPQAQPPGMTTMGPNRLAQDPRDIAAAVATMRQPNTQQANLGTGIQLDYNLPEQNAANLPPGVPMSLLQNESGGNWRAQNDHMGAGGMRGHFGRMQFGQARLQDAIRAGAIPEGTTPQQFMQSPELQMAAERWHFADIDRNIQQMGFDRLVGQQINGTPITMEGMRAVAHLGGVGGLRRFIESGGAYNPPDPNGTTLSAYLARHGGGGVGATERAAGSVGTQAPAAPSGPSREALVAAATSQYVSPAVRQIAMTMLQQQMQTQPTQLVQRPDGTFVFDPRRQSLTRIGDAPPRDPVAVPEGSVLRDPRTGAVIGEPNGTNAPTVRQIKQPDGSEVAVQWDRASGQWVPLRAPEGGNAVTSNRPLTEAQSKDNVFATRATGALETLDRNANALLGIVDRVAGLDPTGLIRGNVQSDQYQVARVAADEFLQAILRKDTGAAITAGEQELYGRTYLPQPGDNAAALAQKAEARRRAVAAIRSGMSRQQLDQMTSALFFSRQQEQQQPGASVPATQGTPATPVAPAQAPQRIRLDAQGNLRQ